MKTVIAALSAAALLAATPAAMAMGASSKTSGHEMHLKGAKKSHHGTSAQASKREMQAKETKTGAPAAAPGQTTGSNTKRSY